MRIENNNVNGPFAEIQIGGACDDMPKDLNAEFAAGRGIICNANTGLGIKISETDDGRAVIEVDPHPPCAAWPDAKALHAFMEETAIEWLRQVAPHRLALGANER